MAKLLPVPWRGNRPGSLKMGLRHLLSEGLRYPTTGIETADARRSTSGLPAPAKREE